ncbi:NAD-dependent epimerase/dehydratase family protein [Natribacillus halophilus]|uniref:UDP-glucose 4-epimerase n=1 Tax=Natribacillus halophilus TaxID=549003 RepID=A0A1G8KFP7_9BACI|nr:NAD-dependent epimerase/dehydratase family protein [Natribacillus halophilus]SDI42225.1 UDP-glucose 4-epimerase [Natribacillus halophilus]
MKRVLITGVNSYVGNSLETWLSKDPDNYSVDKISLRDHSWKDQDFSNYDTVIHVAGIAHVSKDPKMEEKYYQINRDLTIEAAKKAKTENVQQFVFMSSIIVYGNAVGEDGVIDEGTVPQPSDFYGNSKLQAEKGIESLSDETFKVAIVRPPLIYGNGSKGNYPKLAKAAQKLPIFPDFDNKRSMIHIDNLCEFLRLMIDNEEKGLFFPQNKEYVKTSDIVKTISEVHGKNMKLVKLFNPILKLMQQRVGIVNKVFGNLVYDKNLSRYKEKYQVRNFRKSIELTESGNNVVVKKSTYTGKS